LSLLSAAWAVVFCTGLEVWNWHRFGPRPGAQIVVFSIGLGVVGLATTLWWLNLGLSTTTLNGDGLRASALFRRRLYPWPEISRISTMPFEGARGGLFTGVLVDLTSGQSVRLRVPAPFRARTDLGPAEPDPRLAADVAQLRDYLFRATGRASTPR
jgi:Bacterial PH domain